MSYQQYKSLDKNLIFAEYFNDEQSVRRNGGVPTDVTFDKGVATLSESSSRIEYKGYQDKAVFPLSFRCKVRFANETSDMVVFQFGNKDEDGMNLSLRVASNCVGVSSGGADHATSLSAYDFTEWHEIVGTTDRLTTNMYVDGELAVDSSSPWAIVHNTLRISGRDDYGDNSPQFPFEGDLEFLEIYNKALTQEEVTNLYNDARYKLPNLEHKAQGDGTDLNVSDCVNTSYSTFTNVTATGFTATSDGVTTHIGGVSDEMSVVSGQRYLIDFNLLLNSGTVPSVRFFQGLHTIGISEIVLCSNGHNSIILTPTVTTTISLGFFNSSTTTNYTVSNLSVQNLTVNETKEILNVNAFDGVARNRLSGDVAGDNLVENAFFETDTVWDKETGWTISDGKAHCDSTGLGGDRDLKQHAILDAGKKYRYTIKCSSYTSGSVTIYSTGGIYATCVTGQGVYVIELNTDLTGIYLRDEGFIGSLDYVIVEEIIPEVTNTNIEVVKEGQIRVARNTQSGSRIVCGDYNDLTGDITVLTWLKANSQSKYGNGAIINNGELWLYLSSSYRVVFSSDGATTNPSSGTNGFNYRDYFFFVGVRKANGEVTMYIDGELSGTADQDSGTPVAGTADITVSNREAGTRTLDGDMAEMRVIEGLLTPAEISQAYSSTKHLYNK